MTYAAINSLRYHATVDHLGDGHSRLCPYHREDKLYTCYCDSGKCEPVSECPECSELIATGGVRHERTSSYKRSYRTRHNNQR
jgi:hypothetical protein